MNFLKITKNILSTPYALLFSIRATPFDFRHFYFFSIDKRNTKKWIIILFLLLIINAIYCYLKFEYFNFKLYVNFFLPFVYLPSLNKFFESRNPLKFVYNSCIIHSIMQILDILTVNNIQENSIFYMDSNFFGLAANSTIFSYFLCSIILPSKYSNKILKIKMHSLLILSLLINIYYCHASQTLYNFIFSIFLLILFLPLQLNLYRKNLFKILTKELNPPKFIKKISKYKLNWKVLSIYIFIFLILFICFYWTYFLFKDLELTGTLFRRAKYLKYLYSPEFNNIFVLIIGNGLDSFRYIFGDFSHNILAIFQFELGLAISFYFLYIYTKKISSYKFSLPIILYTLFLFFSGLLYIGYPSYQYLVMAVCIIKSTEKLENTLS